MFTFALFVLDRLAPSFADKLRYTRRHALWFARAFVGSWVVFITALVVWVTTENGSAALAIYLIGEIPAAAILIWAAKGIRRDLDELKSDAKSACGTILGAARNFQGYTRIPESNPFNDGLPF